MNLKCKIIILLILFLIQFPLSGQQITNADYYFDGVNGSDSNNGLTPATAWQTLDKLQTLLNTSSANNKVIAIRDSIEYRRASGSKENYSITLGIPSGVRITNWYGSDSDSYPRIIGSRNYTGSWTNHSGNVWKLSTSMSNQHSVWRDYTDSIKWFIQKSSVGALTQNERFYFDGSTLYVYTTTNPNSGGIEVEWYTNGIYLSTNNNHIDHLELVMHSFNGISVQSLLSGNVITYNTISYNGTTDLGDRGNGIQNYTGNVRISNNWIEGNSSHAIQTYQDNGETLSNIYIDSNYCYLEYHTGIDFNAQGGSIFTGNYVRYNTIWNPQYNPYREVREYGAGFFFNAYGNSTNEAEVAYNLVYRITEDPQITGGEYGAYINNGADITFINNTFYHCGSRIIGILGGSNVVLRNNIFHNVYSGVTRGLVLIESGTISAQSGNIGYGDMMNLSGTSTDPLFISLSPLALDFHLQSGSPAINIGSNYGYTFDLDGNPIVGNPDAGAYEFTGGGGGGNNPPNQPSNPNPANGAIDQLVNLTITWTCTDPDGDPLTYDIYFGTSNNPPLASSNQPNASFNPGQLNDSTTYYWKIVAKDNQGASTSGPVWNFTTEANRGGDITMLEIVEVTASVIPEPEHHPGKTIDGKGYYQGDPDSRWAGDTMPEWIMFDLGVANNISLVKLSFYNWNNGRIYNYSLEVSNDLVQWTEVLSNVSSSSEEWTENAFSNIEARYIRVDFISSNQNGWAGLWEAEIWGFNTTSVEEEKSSPEGFKLEQNYPNPFNPTTNIPFAIPKDSKVKLSVYNLLGEEVAELTNSEFTAGYHKISFNANGFPSGIYFYRMEVENYIETKKMIFVK